LDASLFLAVSFTIVFIVAFFYKKKNKRGKTPEINRIYTEALNSMVRGNKRKSISLLKEVVKIDSDHVPAYLQLGNIIREENPEHALKIHQSLTVRPNLPIELRVDIHKALAIDYKNVKQMEKSKIEIEKILIIEKRNLWALSFLVDLSELDKEWDKAALYSKQLQKITGKIDNSSLAQFEVYKGLEKLEEGLLKEAKPFFLKAIKISPKFPLSYFYLGNLYEQTRDLVKAVENWELYAVNNLKNSFKVFTKIESALFDLGRYSEVENFYKRILEINDENLHAIIRLANVLDEKGERIEAIALLDTFLIDKNGDIRTDLMKLKLLVPTSTPIELTQKIDVILEKTLSAKLE